MGVAYELGVGPMAVGGAHKPRGGGLGAEGQGVGQSQQ
jgi:hypothetical protein